MNTRKDLSLPLTAVRERLGSARGKQYWRSLEELADTPAFQELVGREFSEPPGGWGDALSRRQFLTLMGASLALAGLSGCSVKPAPAGKIVPYVRAPEEVVPGRPLFFATAMELGGTAIGLLAESHQGRPTKIEGNPDHPASLGATDAFAQASVLSLYDPDRSQTVTYLGQTRTWGDAVNAIREIKRKHQEGRGAGLRILTEMVTAPTLAGQVQALLKQFPQARWHQYEPAGRNAERAGAQLAFGEDVHTYYRFARARRILALDADFLSCYPGNLRYTRDFADGRRVWNGKAEMSRLYAIESTPSLTGAKADHRLMLQAHAIEGFARALAARLGVPGIQGAGMPGDVPSQWIDALVRDFQDHRGASLVLTDSSQPAAVHALVQAINQALGNFGQTVIHTAPLETRPEDPIESLRQLVNDMDRGQVEVLLVVGGNPAYNAPADFQFAERLRKVPLCLHLGLYQDETARWCHWHMPEAHYLESWGDVRAYDGTASIVQPLIAPLYGGRSASEILALFVQPEEPPGYDLVRDTWRRHWQNQGSKDDFELLWRTAVHDGIVAGTALPPRQVTLKTSWADDPALREAAQPASASDTFEIIFRPDPTVYDGRFANNAWLQELPKPLTKLTWDNAVLISPATATELGLEQQLGWQGGERGQIEVDIVELRYRGRTVRGPAWITPGHPDRSATVHLGYGRSFAGKVGSGLGFNAYELRTADAPWFDRGLSIRKTGERYQLACTQYHHLLEKKGREAVAERRPVHATTLAELTQRPTAAHNDATPGRVPLTMYPPLDKDRYETGYRWGMAIDLSACVGCKACVVACQSENNIPVVGKEEVLRGREMHWLRIDRYYYGPPDDPETYFQPVPCMHCEMAPCEYVCPTEATVHSADGLNEMVYNRCVGTRYCSNNCPYKVRRFNFFEYQDYASENLKLLRNPDVTVRSRGVMEKCTYCVQRIRAADIAAEKGGRRIRDGEVVTACAAACPANAIVFGDINDRGSKVAKMKAQPLNYSLLEELNTRPRTTYLAAVRNPNRELGAT
jgi:MoCo/4Fe-4S cofactor protein with predicted Tat translocation signal